MNSTTLSSAAAHTRGSTGALNFILERKVWGCSWGFGVRGGRVSAELLRGAYTPRCPGRPALALPSPAGPLIIFCEICMWVMKLLASSEDGRMERERKKNQQPKTNQKPLKAFYLPIKMSQAVSAQASLPVVGLATMLQ